MMIKYKSSQVRSESVLPSDPVALAPLPLLPVHSCTVLENKGKNAKKELNKKMKTVRERQRVIYTVWIQNG